MIPRQTPLLIVVAVLLSACEEEPPEFAEHIRAIKTTTVSERGSGQLRRFPGTVQAVDTSVLSFEVGGNTRQVNVEAGDEVVEGEVLATLDETPFTLDVEAAEAELGRARAGLAEKDTNYQRQKTLYDKEWVSKAALDQAVAAKDSALNEVSYAQSKLNLARRDLDKTKLVAPFDGVIAAKLVDPFQEVARGEKVFEIYVDGAMEVLLSVPETSIGDIYLGLPAEISLPAEQVPPMPGRASEIGTVASEANAFAVKVILIDPNPAVLPGMTAEVSLLLGSDQDASSYLIPVSAIAPGEEPGQGYVFVYDPETSTVEKTPIRGGGIQDDRVFITEGIEAGDVVAVAGVSFLQDGQKVKLLQQ